MDSGTALKELKDFQGTRKGASDYYSDAQNELGVGTAQARSNDLLGLVRNTEKQLQGVGESVAGRTRGNLVTEAQRARLQNLEERPIAESLGGLQTSYGDSQTNYRDLLGQAGTRAGLSYQTDQDKVAGLQSQYDRLFGQEQKAAEEARWRQQFDAERAAADRQFTEMQRQFNEGQNNIKKQYAQQASFNQSGINAQNTARADVEKQMALATEADRQAKIQAKTDADWNAKMKSIDDNAIGDWWNSLPTSGIGNWLGSIFGGKK